MRIAFLTPEFPSADQPHGGLANYLARTAEVLATLGVEATIFVPQSAGTAPPARAGRVVRVPLPDAPDADLIQPIEWAPVAWWLTRARVLAEAFWREHARCAFDLVQAPDYGACGDALLGNGRIPVVCRSSNYRPWWRAKADLGPPAECEPLLDALELRQMAMADAAFAPSTAIARAYELAGVERVAVLRTLPPDPDALAARSDARPIAQPYLLFYGQCSRQKGFDTLFSCVPRWLRSDPNLRFAVAGPVRPWPDVGDPIAALREACGPHADRLAIFPTLDVDRLIPLVRGALAAVVPSPIDNLPNTALEALACGVPVFGFRESSLEEVVENDVNGWLAPPGDLAALADAVERFLRHAHDVRPRWSAAAVARSRERRTGPETAALVGFYRAVSLRDRSAAATNEPHPVRRFFTHIHTVQRNLAEADERERQLRSYVALLEERSRESAARLANETSRADEAARQRDAFGREVARLGTELDAARGRIDELDCALRKAHEDFAAATARRDELHREVQRLGADLAEAAAQRDAFHSANGELRKQLDEAAAALARQRDLFDRAASERDRFYAKLEELKRLYAEAAAQRDRNDAENQKLHELFAQATEQRDRNWEEVERLQALYAEAAAQRDRFYAELVALTTASSRPSQPKSTR